MISFSTFKLFVNSHIGTCLFLIGLFFLFFKGTETCAQPQIFVQPDSGFGSNGRKAVQQGVSQSGQSGHGVRSLQLYSDGRILLGATSKPFTALNYQEYFAARLLENGEYDQTFNDSGRIFIKGEPTTTGAMHRAVIGPNNTVILAGNRPNPFSLIDETYVVKLKADGSCDSSFATNGILTLNVSPHGSRSGAYDVAILPNEKILLASQVQVGSGNPGLEFCVIRLNANGSLDESFGDAGKTFIVDSVRAATPYRMVVQRNGRIVVGGITTINGVPTFKVIRLLENGDIDNDFGVNGILLVDRGEERTPNFNDILEQPDGKIILAGNYSAGAGDSRLTLVRLKSDGSRDENFGTNGIVDIQQASIANKVLINEDKTILAIGRNFDQVVIAKFKENGSLDFSFGDQGVEELGNANPSNSDLTAVLMPDGKVMIGGLWTDNNLNHFSLLKVKFVPQAINSSETFSVAQVGIYPNPAVDFIHIQPKQPYNTNCRILDVSGRMLQQLQINSEQTIDLQNIPAGIYILELSANADILRTKFIRR